MLAGASIAFLPSAIVADELSHLTTGPVLATVTRITDGDTFHVAVKLNGHRTVRATIRIRNIDTPELGRRARCAAEARRAAAAKGYLEELLPRGQRVQLVSVAPAFHGRRTQAHVRLEDGRDLADLLVRSGYAKRWPKGRPKPTWCPR